MNEKLENAIPNSVLNDFSNFILQAGDGGGKVPAAPPRSSSTPDRPQYKKCYRVTSRRPRRDGSSLVVIRHCIFLTGNGISIIGKCHKGKTGNEIKFPVNTGKNGKFLYT